MIKGTAHICIAATDLARSEQFYTQALGFQRHFSFIRDGQPFGYYFALPDGTFVEVFKEAEAAAQGKPLIRHFCLLVDDLDATVADLRAKGVDVSDKKLGMDQSWQAWITDPAGIRIELHQYTANSSQYTRRDCIAQPAK